MVAMQNKPLRFYDYFLTWTNLLLYYKGFAVQM